MIVCPRCSSRNVDGSEYSSDTSFKCVDCERFISGFYLEQFVEMMFQRLDNSGMDLMKGSPPNLPALVRVSESDVVRVDSVKIEEKVLTVFIRGSTGMIEREYRRSDFDVSESGVSRQKLLNKNLNELFGYPESYRCRICNNPLDDGRKMYCSVFCRENAYEFQKKYVWSHVRKTVIERDGGCVICGAEEDLEVDHVTPVSEGGSYHDSDNLQTLCKEHHKSKSRENGDYSS